MTTLLHETWEAGTNGAACTAANTSWDKLVTRFTFDNTHVPTGQGSLSGKLAVTAQTAQAQANVTAADRGYEETWWYADALPPTEISIASFRNSAAAANLADLRLASDGTISIRDAGFTKVASSAPGAFHTGTPMKIQRMYGNDSGQARLMVFWTNPAGNSPDYDSGLVSTTAAGQITVAQVGAINATTWTAWVGDYTLSDSGFPISGGGTGSGGTVTWRDSASAQFADAGHNTTLTIPATVATGDVMVLQFVGGQQNNQTDPSGWTRLGVTQSTSGLQFDAWQKTATSTDHGTTVNVVSDNAASFSRHLHLDVFTGGKVGDTGSALASSAGTAHNTPNVVTVDPQAWVLSGCADRGSPSSSSWSLPSNLTQRTVQIQTTGSAIVSSVTATDDAVGTGTLGSNTFVGTVSTSKAVSWTVAIEPTTAVSPLTVNAGPDIFVEPWRSFTIAPTASSTPDSWTWSQPSGVAASGFTTPGTVTDMTAGATVDANGTIHLTAPAATVPMQYTLRVTGHKSGVTPDPFDNMVVNVFPATRWAVAANGAVKPVRYSKVT